MLELPESRTIAKQITDNLKGKTIDYVTAGHTPHKFAFFHGDKENYDEMLQGQSIVKAVNRGGMIEIDTEDCMILLFDGAYPKYCEKKAEFPKRHQFLRPLTTIRPCPCRCRCMRLSEYIRWENAVMNIIFRLSASVRLWRRDLLTSISGVCTRIPKKGDSQSISGNRAAHTRPWKRCAAGHSVECRH
ncbi:hypothetical protein LC724_27895 [Blautia sp. RD014234]|nr:hypothetical protein [Blautia parvula]